MVIGNRENKKPVVIGNRENKKPVVIGNRENKKPNVNVNVNDNVNDNVNVNVYYHKTFLTAQIISASNGYPALNLFLRDSTHQNYLYFYIKT